MICDQITQSEYLTAEGALRLGLIAYRDHPPQDHVYIVKNCMCAVLTVKLALPLLCYK